jgi:hypothetical protein
MKWFIYLKSFLIIKYKKVSVMKKLILSLSVMLAGLVPVLANDQTNDPSAEKVFASLFVGASDARWTKLANGYQKVNFSLNGVRAESIFDENAELLGTVRILFFNQVPLSVMQTIGSRFPQAVVVDVREISNAEGTSYRIVFELKNKRYTVRLNSLGSILEQQKTKISK